MCLNYLWRCRSCIDQRQFPLSTSPSLYSRSGHLLPKAWHCNVDAWQGGVGYYWSGPWSREDWLSSWVSHISWQTNQWSLRISHFLGEKWCLLSQQEKKVLPSLIRSHYLSLHKPNTKLKLSKQEGICSLKNLVYRVGCWVHVARTLPGTQ